MSSLSILSFVGATLLVAIVTRLVDVRLPAKGQGSVQHSVPIIATVGLSSGEREQEPSEVGVPAAGLPPLEPWGSAKLVGAVCAGSALTIYLGLSLLAG